MIGVVSHCMRRRRQVRASRRPARRSRAAAARPRARSARAGGAAPRSPSLAEVLKFQVKSTAALRAVKMPMAVEPSFVFKP